MVLSSSPLCAKCEQHGRTTPAVDVHHRIPMKQRPDLTYVRSNLEPLCKACHTREEKAHG
ncbi:MAG: HNH endonuclease [Acidimicrobiia bacterium]|nr:HNH endonuclease [Acidimicrobiia bacterium]